MLVMCFPHLHKSLRSERSTMKRMTNAYSLWGISNPKSWGKTNIWKPIIINWLVHVTIIQWQAIKQLDFVVSVFYIERMVDWVAGTSSHDVVPKRSDCNGHPTVPILEVSLFHTSWWYSSRSILYSLWFAISYSHTMVTWKRPLQARYNISATPIRKVLLVAGSLSHLRKHSFKWGTFRYTLLPYADSSESRD